LHFALRSFDYFSLFTPYPLILIPFLEVPYKNSFTAFHARINRTGLPINNEDCIAKSGYNVLNIIGMDKIVERRKLKDIVAELKQQGKKIVFTNGCFDLIHIGHVRYLTEAKKLGDILIIGLNSDSSVSRLKPGRPITPEKERSEVLSALYMVDFITLFSEDTPYELIKEIRPDILVKGADWDIKDIVGADLVKEVRNIPFVQGISTTNIIQRIQGKT